MTEYRIVKQGPDKAVSELLFFIDLTEDERIVIQKLVHCPQYVEVTEVVEVV